VGRPKGGRPNIHLSLYVCMYMVCMCEYARYASMHLSLCVYSIHLSMCVYLSICLGSGLSV